MKTTLLLTCALLLTLPVPAVPAQEEQVAAPEDLKNLLSGLRLEEATRVESGPFTMLTGPLPEYVDLEGLAISAAAAGDERILNEVASKPYVHAVGTSITEPTIFMGIVSNDLLPLASSPYYYYWFVVNFSTFSEWKRTSLKLKGPGNDFSVSDEVLYPGASWALVWVQANAVGVAGVYKWEVKVSGSPKIKSRLCIGCF